MDTNVLQYLPYLLLTAGGVLGAIGVIVVSLLKSVNGLAKFLGMLLAVCLITLAIYFEINGVAVWFYAKSPGLAYIFWIAFSGLLSLLTSVVVVYRASFAGAKAAAQANAAAESNT